MAAKYWIKLYHEILHDPKMGRLPDRLWRRAIELFLIAGETGNDGVLPSVEDMAWTLRVSPQELLADLEELAKIGIVTLADDMLPLVTHFADRQAAVSDAERMKQYRERKRKAQYYGDEPVTGDVTNCNTEPDTESESDNTIVADAPSVPDTSTMPESEPEQQETPMPSTFQEWQQVVREGRTETGKLNNRPASLVWMCRVLYPGLDPPDFGYIGRVAKKVGGAGRLADLLWQHSTRPPTGDLLAYIQQVAKGNGHAARGNGNGSKPTAPGGDDAETIARKLAEAIADRT